MTTITSTRTQTQRSGRYLRTTSGSQSLERGLTLLRAFRLGTGVLTNAELAARSGLPRPTVSRLTRSLVDSGFLAYDYVQQGYRLGSVYLSLALSYRAAQSALDLALPLLRDVAKEHRINIGIAVLDQEEMIYLDTLRFSQLTNLRRMVPGSRIPVALTSLGRAYLSSLPPIDRHPLLRRLAIEHQADWPSIYRQIKTAFRNIRDLGYCWAQWQEDFFSIATPITNPNGERYALNISLAVENFSTEQLLETHGGRLLELRDAVENCWRSTAA